LSCLMSKPAIAGPSKQQNTPETIRFLERIESSKCLNTVSKWLIRNHSINLLSNEDVSVLSSFDKSNIIDKSKIGTAGILLYEFATGEGPSTRYFYKRHEFTQSFIHSPGVQYVLEQYHQQYDSNRLKSFDSCFDAYNSRYQFSPTLVPFKLESWDFSLIQHFETWDRKNISQIILGSFNSDIQYVNDSTIRVHAWNKTSKKSLFGGIGNRWQRPLPLGTTNQHFVFELTLKQFFALIE
jgi:hypothetical protein